MKWQEDVPTHVNGICARYEAQICHSENEIDSLFHFSNDPGGFNFYRSRISASVIWPMAVLLDVEVPHQLRCQGIGTRVVQQFVNVARGKGAVLGFLKVGWIGAIAERDWRVAWYQRLEWHLLPIPEIEGFVIPFMFREL
jgi:predicted GNAT family acetyltransferase